LITDKVATRFRLAENQELLAAGRRKKPTPVLAANLWSVTKLAM
jgi:hypothetical protein